MDIVTGETKHRILKIKRTSIPDSDLDRGHMLEQIVLEQRSSRNGDQDDTFDYLLVSCE